MLLNREYQRSLLLQLAEAYPASRSPAQLGLPSDEEWNVNATYLAERDLLRIVSTGEYLDGSPSQVLTAQITADGLDFLADDGGLKAALGVVTVRFEAETLRALIGEHITASALPAEQKSRVMSWLQAAGSEALKEATKRLVGVAIDHAPEAIQLLQRLRD